jgi:glycosyltransferase involved in cell wall biosynthesis
VGGGGGAIDGVCCGSSDQRGDRQAPSSEELGPQTDSSNCDPASLQNRRERLVNLSIVTVTHHRSEILLEKASPSLQQQTCSNFEWVVINDGCDVATRQAIEAFQKANPRMAIQYFDLDHPQEGFGLAHGRNVGLSYANYDWICYLDDDNSFVPNFVEESLGFLASHSEALYIITQQSRRRYVYVDGQVVKQGMLFLSPTSPCDVHMNGASDAIAVLIRP